MQNSNFNITTESGKTDYIPSKCVIMLADENKTNEHTKMEIEIEVHLEIQEETKTKQMSTQNENWAEVQPEIQDEVD
ncbi:hypothetical protein F8M41_015591 [Gigaspora margarita]|uniref:Uncharacterized protein n=1 Tax=Gigaspora margarita TaxID=4874 RepID=A0A8H4EN84_GIGMA|nr:hypothetical protein F8M41_015591 [Gigaspora margarita]